MQNVNLNTSIYVYPYIYFRIKATRSLNLLPTIKYAPYTHASMRIQSYQSQLSPTACSHLQSCHSSTYLLIWAQRYSDPCITIQANDIHTIARRMDDESKNPPCQYLDRHLIVLNRGKRRMSLVQFCKLVLTNLPVAKVLVKIDFLKPKLGF